MKRKHGKNDLLLSNIQVDIGLVSVFIVKKKEKNNEPVNAF